MSDRLQSSTAQLTRTKRELLENLKKIPYFEGLTDAEFLYLVNQGYPQTVSPLEYVCREGDTANSFYVILTGKVEVISLRKKQHIATLNSGDFFGEIALFMGTPRVATCRTLERSRFFVIHRDHLKYILAIHKEIAEKIAQKLLDRQNTLIDLGIIRESDCTSDTGIALNLIHKRLQTLFRA